MTYVLSSQVAVSCLTFAYLTFLLRVMYCSYYKSLFQEERLKREAEEARLREEEKERRKKEKEEEELRKKEAEVTGD